MSANTTIWVQVVTEKKEWRKISALTLTDAMADAHAEWDDVVRVERAQYENPASSPNPEMT